MRSEPGRRARVGACKQPAASPRPPAAPRARRRRSHPTCPTGAPHADWRPSASAAHGPAARLGRPDTAPGARHMPAVLDRPRALAVQRVRPAPRRQHRVLARPDRLGRHVWIRAAGCARGSRRRSGAPGGCGRRTRSGTNQSLDQLLHRLNPCCEAGAPTSAPGNPRGPSNTWPTTRGAESPDGCDASTPNGTGAGRDATTSPVGGRPAGRRWLYNPATVSTTRYRYRAARIETPWQSGRIASRDAPGYLEQLQLLLHDDYRHVRGEPDAVEFARPVRSAAASRRPRATAA
jgi:hypothetical protein